jgi:hypothetical protein
MSTYPTFLFPVIIARIKFSLARLSVASTRTINKRHAMAPPAGLCPQINSCSLHILACLVLEFDEFVSAVNALGVNRRQGVVALFHNQSLTPVLKTINPDIDWFHEAERS